MKYAIMSDVHANPKALETALADARRLGCGKFILLGDVTGYGYDPKATLEIVRRNFDVVLMGNHDSACVELEPEWEVKMNYNYDFDRMARGLLTEEERAWLRGRAYQHEEAGFICAHGDFTQPKMWNYIIYEDAAERNFRFRDEQLMFCGHTHHAAVWKASGDAKVTCPSAKRIKCPAGEPETIVFKRAKGARYIVNVGSVGYPRSDLCATYAICDPSAGSFAFRRLPFDFKSYVTEMLSRGIGLPAWLYRLLAAAGEMASE